jgi:cytochrome c biogenesis protein CcmG/thiol:disulfide interchange protein DsbE
MSTKRLLAIVGGALALVAVVAIAATAGGGSGGAGAQTRPVEVTGVALPAYTGAVPDAAAGMPAAQLHGESFDGSPVDVVGDGRPKVVLFLAHWCPHCRAEVPRIVDWLAAGGMPVDVDLYAVSTATNADAPNYPPSEWLSAAQWPITTLADDADSSAAAAYGLRSFPYFVALAADGTVAARASGELTQEQFDALVQAALTG